MSWFRRLVWPPGISVRSGAEVDFEAGSRLEIAGADRTATLANAVAGVVPGLRVARGVHTTTTASDTIAAGLTTVLTAVASLESAPVVGCNMATAAVGNQAGAPPAGSIIIQTWRPTSTTDTTPAAANTFSRLVSWVAVGT